MNFHHGMDSFSFFLSASSFSILFLFTLFRLSNANDHIDIHFTSCAPFDCGTILNISYPFWTDHLNRSSYCGYADEGYKLKCSPNEPPLMSLSSQDFQVMNLTQSRGLLTIKRVESETCPREILITQEFNYSFVTQNISLVYDCRFKGIQNRNFSCRRGGRDTFPVVLVEGDENECDSSSEKVEIPVGIKAFDDLRKGITAVNRSLLQVFDMRYFAYENYCKECKDSGGRCGSNQTVPSAFVCYCPDRPHQLKCSTGMPHSLTHQIKCLNGMPACFNLCSPGGIQFIYLLRRP